MIEPKEAKKYIKVKTAVAIVCIALLAMIISVVIFVWPEKPPKMNNTPTRAAETAKVEQIQIYPNYEFLEGVNQIKVPLIPSHFVLPREAGGWVIAPLGSRIRIDYKVSVVIENIDGKKFRREPGKPAWDGVEPGNGIFRLYGQKGKYAIVAIKRGVY